MNSLYDKREFIDCMSFANLISHFNILSPISPIQSTYKLNLIYLKEAEYIRIRQEKEKIEAKKNVEEHKIVYDWNGLSTGIIIGDFYKIKNVYSENVLNSWGSETGKGTVTMKNDDIKQLPIFNGILKNQINIIKLRMFINALNWHLKYKSILIAFKMMFRTNNSIIFFYILKN
jgi:hypothetical protein